ncbi:MULTISPECIES: response regulator [unclassified Paenibacillus]|uniref:response regulator n=1 Tax=unclassified Paenibacillus TaxID=185978 RepID=UPI00210A8EE3|nr:MULTISPECIES: response regulator [unclassified Paenibacillus]
MLIVDDEASVRSGLQDCVDWSSLGIRAAGEAEDGEMALQAIEDMDVHIVVTDVRMPHMDGITLARKLREIRPAIKIVFISGFGDLDYLKQALKLEAIDYILKPVRLSELRDVFRRVVLLLEEEELERKQLTELQHKVNQSIPLLRERFLTALVADGIRDTEAMHDKFEFLGIRLPADMMRCTVIVIRIDDYSKAVGPGTEKDKQLISFALLNICEDVVNSRLCGHVFEIRPGQYAGLIHIRSDEEEEALFHVIRESKEQINRLLKLDVTIGVGAAVGEWTTIPESYRMALEATEHKWYLGKNRIITMDSLTPERPSSAAGQPAPAPDARSIESILKAPQWEQVKEWIARRLDASGQGGLASIQQVRMDCMQIALTCSQLLAGLGLYGPELQASEQRVWTELLTAETIGDLELVLLGHVSLAYSAIADKRERKTKNVITLIRQFIDEHYARELTNAEIAASVYLTTTYVCLLFKQETGMTLNEYVIEARIREAKRLLADPRNKLYDVCYAVGYKDPGYFSKLFKKQTGLTPSEFRERPL